MYLSIYEFHKYPINEKCISSCLLNLQAQVEKLRFWQGINLSVKSLVNDFNDSFPSLDTRGINLTMLRLKKLSFKAYFCHFKGFDQKNKWNLILQLNSKFENQSLRQCNYNAISNSFLGGLGLMLVGLIFLSFYSQFTQHRKQNSTS